MKKQMGVAIMPENNKTINDVTQLIKDAIAAVSYTHLDVYKRQVYSKEWSP